MANTQTQTPAAAPAAPTTPAPSTSYTTADFNRDQKSVKELLDACPKVKIRLSLPEGMTQEDLKDGKHDLSEFVAINGYAYRIMRGVTVEVPEPVAQLLEDVGKL